jgi:hypothetical protein
MSWLMFSGINRKRKLSNKILQKDKWKIYLHIGAAATCLSYIHNLGWYILICKRDLAGTTNHTHTYVTQFFWRIKVAFAHRLICFRCWHPILREEGPQTQALGIHTTKRHYEDGGRCSVDRHSAPSWTITGACGWQMIERVSKSSMRLAEKHVFWRRINRVHGVWEGPVERSLIKGNRDQLL